MTDRARPPAATAASIVRRLARLLQQPSAAAIGQLAPISDRKAWAQVERLITVHGLAAHLFSGAGPDHFAATLPAPTVEWLTAQNSLNAQRIDRMHRELGEILEAAAVVGIEVMPLKGALLTTMPEADPHRRPMGDLDLLVRPGDRRPLGKLLERLGYHLEPEANPRPTHDVYVDPGGGRIVSRDEHPDNPRRVEVHTELLRHLWGWLDDDRLTPAMWRDAVPGVILGAPALIPTHRHLLAHVAIHATADLLGGRGRLVQWLDIGVLAASGQIEGNLGELPHSRVAYPSLKLAQRALPAPMAGLPVADMEARIPGRLVHWASSVPPDNRSGLMIGPHSRTPHSLAARAMRWAPVPWRLSVAYGDRTPPVALALHARLLAGRWRGRFSYRAVRPDGG